MPSDVVVLEQDAREVGRIVNLGPEPTGLALRDEALERVDAHASEAWRAAADAALLECLRVHREFTGDEVWLVLDLRHPTLTTGDPRAMGPVFMRAAAAGLIVKAPYVRNSIRASQHCRPIQVWRPATDPSCGFTVDNRVDNP